jgi:hypothetical protein
MMGTSTQSAWTTRWMAVWVRWVWRVVATTTTTTTSSPFQGSTLVPRHPPRPHPTTTTRPRVGAVASVPRRAAFRASPHWDARGRVGFFIPRIYALRAQPPPLLFCCCGHHARCRIPNVPLPQTHLRTRAHTFARTRARTCTLIRARPHSHTHTHPHTRSSHTRTYTLTKTHTHFCALAMVLPQGLATCPSPAPHTPHGWHR